MEVGKRSAGHIARGAVQVGDAPDSKPGEERGEEVPKRVMSLRTPTTAPERGVAVRVLAFPQRQAQALPQGTTELLVG